MMMRMAYCCSRCVLSVRRDVLLAVMRAETLTATDASVHAPAAAWVGLELELTV